MIQRAPTDVRAGASFEAASRRLRTRRLGGNRFQSKAARSRRLERIGLGFDRSSRSSPATAPASCRRGRRPKGVTPLSQPEATPPAPHPASPRKRHGCPGKQEGLRCRLPLQPQIVVAGLVPAIHVRPQVQYRQVCRGGATGMAGTSPAMTRSGCGARQNSRPERSRHLPRTAVRKRGRGAHGAFSSPLPASSRGEAG